MRTVNSIPEMRAASKLLKKEGKTIALVPTMGYLHEGHMSLVHGIRKKCDFLVSSIFVNPAQFAEGEDLDRYPADPERDKLLLGQAGVDILFLPAASEIYPLDFQTYVDVKKLSRRLCGAARPGHFRGVTTVVAKLFNIIAPDIAVFGEKDFQQMRVIRQMVEDLNFDIEIIGMPIVREKDGLAMSSRNTYLSEGERVKACSLYRSLMEGRRLFSNGEKNAGEIERMAKGKLAKGIEIDYLKVCDADSLEPVETIKDRAVFAIAAQVGRARLIDNIILEEDKR